MDPKRAMVLKHYNKLNQNLFDYRKLIKNIKITIIRRAYIAYSKMQKDTYLIPQKFVIMSKAFRSSENSDLKGQLKAIETVENGRNECLLPKSMSSQNFIKSNVFKVFDNDYIPSFKSRSSKLLSYDVSSFQQSAIISYTAQSQVSNNISKLASNKSQNSKSYKRFIREQNGCPAKLRRLKIINKVPEKRCNSRT